MNGRCDAAAAPQGGRLTDTMVRSPICASASPGFPQDPPGDLPGGEGVIGRRARRPPPLAGQDFRLAELLKLVTAGRGRVTGTPWFQAKVVSAHQQDRSFAPPLTPPQGGVWLAPPSVPAVVNPAPRLRAHVTRFRRWRPDVLSALPCGPAPVGFPTAPTEGWDYTLADSGGDFGE